MEIKTKAQSQQYGKRREPAIAQIAHVVHGYLRCQLWRSQYIREAKLAHSFYPIVHWRTQGSEHIYDPISVIIFFRFSQVSHAFCFWIFILLLKKERHMH